MLWQSAVSVFARLFMVPLSQYQAVLADETLAVPTTTVFPPTVASPDTKLTLLPPRSRGR